MGEAVSDGRGTGDSGRSRRAVVFLALGATLAVVLAACGGGSSSDPRMLDAGQVDIKLPAGYRVEGKKIIAPAQQAAPPSTAAAPVSSDSTPNPNPGVAPPSTAKSAVPLNNKSDPTGDLLKSFGKFRDCLNELGVKFIGAPNPNDPQSPTNDPDYLKSLSTCAARSNIVQALQAAQAANDNLTPAQIKQRNKGYLMWRDCMINRGWNVPKPTPDAQGRLFNFSTNGQGPQLKPPPGKDLFNSKDIEQCATKVAKKFPNQQG
jgi:hypothetical protein